MKSGFLRHLALPLLVIPSIHAAELEIPAGAHPREQSIVTIGIPSGMSGPLALRTDQGRTIPLQQTPNGQLTFILPHLGAGETLRCKIVPLPPVADAVLAEKDGDQIRFLIGGRSAAGYQMTARESPRPGLDPKFLRGGYLHPLITPSGKTVTDDYALNHLHHHGVWMAWTKASYDSREPDFWNMGQGKGRVDFVSLENSWSGPVEAGLVSKHKYTDLTSGSPVDVLNETWTVKTYAAGSAYRIIDLEATQTTASDKPLLLPIYHYGGLGIRGLEAWNGKDKATFVTSEKNTDRQKANGQPARWIRMSGMVDGAMAGIAILSHPENIRSPQPVRIHPSEPFISFAPQTHEAMSIQPGETYRARYRFIVSDGDTDPGLIERLWQDYAAPVKAVWKN